MAVKKSSQATPKKENITEETNSSSMSLSLETVGYYHIRTTKWRVLVWASSVEEARKICSQHGEKPINNDADDYYFGPDVDDESLTRLYAPKKLAA